MAVRRGILYAIDGAEVSTPDEEVWFPISSGESLTAAQKRSPYYRLEWRRTVSGPCNLDWFDYDNTTLSSLTCRPPGRLDVFTTYTDAKCQSVVLRQRLNVATEIVATFLVFVG